MQETGARGDSDGTSSSDGEVETKRKQRRLEQSAWDPTLANLSFLEGVSVSHGTEAKYKTRVEQFLGFADEEKLALADDEVDAAIVLYLNMSYSQPRPVSDRGSFCSSDLSTGSWGDRSSVGRGEL